MSGPRNPERNPPSQYQNPFQAHSRTWVERLTVKSSLIIHQNPQPYTQTIYTPIAFHIQTLTRSNRTLRIPMVWQGTMLEEAITNCFDAEPIEGAEGHVAPKGTLKAPEQGSRALVLQNILERGHLKKREKLIGTLIRLLCRFLSFLSFERQLEECPSWILKPMAPPLRRLYHVKAHQLSLP